MKHRHLLCFILLVAIALSFSQTLSKHSLSSPLTLHQEDELCVEGPRLYFTAVQGILLNHDFYSNLEGTSNTAKTLHLPKEIYDVVKEITIEGTSPNEFNAKLSDDSNAVEIVFKPTTLGPKYVEILLKSSSSLPIMIIPVHALATKGRGGDNEPSLQWIFDALQLPIKTGDDDPSTAVIHSNSGAQKSRSLGDEIGAQLFKRADERNPVTVEVVAVFGPDAKNPVVTLGWYKAGDPASTQELLRVSNQPEENSQKLYPSYSGTTSFTPDADAAFGFYSQWTFFNNRTLFSEDALNVFQGAVPHHVRVFKMVDRGGNSVPNSFVLATEEHISGFDFQDIIFIVHNVQPVRWMEIEHEASGVAGFWNDLVVMSRIADHMELNSHLFFQETFINIRNVHSNELIISDLIIKNPEFFTFPNKDNEHLPLRIAPNQSHQLRVKFILNDPNGKKGYVSSSLQIISNDPSSPTLITLHGVFMNGPEGGREVNPLVIAHAFGYNVSIDIPMSERIDVALNGEEQRSTYWMRADSSQSVFVRQLAAYHTCCGEKPIFYLNTNPAERMRHGAQYGQTVLPRRDKNHNEFTEMTVNPTEQFVIMLRQEMDRPGYLVTSDVSQFVAFHIYPVRDREDRLMKNTYYLAEDLIPVKGCEPLPGHCDYNDNAFLMTNIIPANPLAPLHRVSSQFLELEFDRVYPQTIQDRQGEGTGFTHTQTNALDHTHGFDSYKADLIDLDSAQGVLHLTSVPHRQSDTLVNALQFNFDSSSMREFRVIGTLRSPFQYLKSEGQHGGIMLGYDRKDFARVSLSSNSVQFYAIIRGKESLVSKQDVTLNAAVTSVQLLLIANPLSLEIRAAFVMHSSTGTTYGILPAAFRVPGYTARRFFDSVVAAGVFTLSTGADTFTATFESFRVMFPTKCNFTVEDGITTNSPMLTNATDVTKDEKFTQQEEYNWVNEKPATAETPITSQTELEKLATKKATDSSRRALNVTKAEPPFVPQPSVAHSYRLNYVLVAAVLIIVHVLII